MIGEHLLEMDWPAGRRLVTSESSAVNRHYNQVAKEQFKIHRIEEQMNAVDSLTIFCGQP